MRAKVGAVLTIIAVLCLFAPLAGAAEPDQSPLPVEVKATGEVKVDRTQHPDCIVAVPQILEGDIEVVVNTATGTVTGSIGNGGGSGNADLLVCGDDAAKRHIFNIEFTGVIKGKIDSRTGEIEAPGPEGNVTVTYEGSGEYGYYPDMPEWRIVEYGGGFVCGLTDSNATVSSCPLAEVRGSLPAELTGTLTPQGDLNFELRWIAPYCEQIRRDPSNPSVRESVWLPEECPGKGTITWTNVVVSNERPVINGLAVDPAEPVTTDVITLTVDASDPDNDKLTYQWFVDGELQQAANSPSTTWTKPPRGDHTIEVRVIDPGGGYDEMAVSIWVADPGERTSESDGAATTTTAITTSTTTTTSPKAAGTTAGKDQKPSRGRTAGGSAVVAVAVAVVGDALRKGQIRGKAGELYRRGKKKADRGKELVEKAERAQAVINDPEILVREEAEKARKRLEKNPKVQRARRKLDRAQAVINDPEILVREEAEKARKRLEKNPKVQRARRKLDRAQTVINDPEILVREEAEKARKRLEKNPKVQRARRKLDRAQTVINDPEILVREEAEKARKRLEKNPKVQRAQRRFGKLRDALDRVRRARRDPKGTLDRVARRKFREASTRLNSRANREYQRIAERLSRSTKGILDPKSAMRLLTSMGNSRRFGQEIRNNRALTRHVIQRAGLSPLAVQALGGPKSIGRMLGRLSRNPGREFRRVGRFLGRPKGWLPEIGRGLRRIGRIFRF